MSKNTGDGELDKIIEDLWSAAVLDTVNTIQKTKPKNSTYVSDNIWYAKTAIKKYAAQEVNKARISELKQLEPPEQWEEFAKLSGSERCNICGFNALEFRRHVQDRIQELTKEKESSDER